MTPLEAKAQIRAKKVAVARGEATPQDVIAAAKTYVTIAKAHAKSNGLKLPNNFSYTQFIPPHYRLLP